LQFVNGRLRLVHVDSLKWSLNVHVKKFEFAHLKASRIHNELMYIKQQSKHEPTKFSTAHRNNLLLWSGKFTRSLDLPRFGGH